MAADSDNRGDWRCGDRGDRAAGRPIDIFPPPKRPTRAELLAAFGKKVPDLIAPGLSVLFCGINPGLYSAATRHHFARPGNRFWPALHAAGFTPRVLKPWEERELLDWGYGITNLVARATAAAAELRKEEFVAGAKRLERKVKRYGPEWVAVVGIGAYRAAFGRPKAVIGPQPERIGPARLWLLPQPSGLNANHQMPELTRAFEKLKNQVLSHRLLERFAPDKSLRPR